MNNVSRETITKYAELLEHWNAQINLVAHHEIAQLWPRHIENCLALLTELPENKDSCIVDMGSGAGLPGMLLACAGYRNVHLIESSHKKAAFLQHCVQVLGVAATIHCCRLESAPTIAADIITARALANIMQLLEYASRFQQPHSRCVFLKGQSVQEELKQARKTWTWQQQRLIQKEKTHIVDIHGWQRILG